MDESHMRVLGDVSGEVSTSSDGRTRKLICEFRRVADSVIDWAIRCNDRRLSRMR